jgi:SAM-dependent methyltransferase
VDPIILTWLAGFSRQKGRFGHVLELGALDVNGSARRVVQADTYTGLDMRPGDGVDVVAFASSLPHRPEWVDHFDCVVATSFFEHDRYFWHTMIGVWRVLKPGGWFVMTVPTTEFPYHGEPKDYWRFTEDAVRECFFEGFQNVEIFNPIWTPPEGQEHLKCQHIGGWGMA